MRTTVRILLSAGLILTGCSSPESDAPDPPPSGVRSIEIEASDSLRFDPDAVSVTAGETIRFVLVNSGGTEHEFILGDEGVQESHAMSGHEGHGEDALAAVELPPGATQEATVTFEDPGTVLYGCHVDGHYEAGMLGTVTISAA